MWLEAAFWGLFSGSALVLGAGIGFWVSLPQRLIAGVMAIGAGVLISALSLELMQEALTKGGMLAASLGFLLGAGVYTAANMLLARWGAKHRKRSGTQQHSEEEVAGSGTAIALGALLDGIPESIVIGVSLLQGVGVSVVTVAAIFLSNVPEGLSSAAGMRRAGRSKLYVVGVWSAIALASSIAALFGNLMLADAAPTLIAGISAVAAGAILAMLSDTMIPEACEGTHDLTGLLTVVGFLAALLLQEWH